MTTPAERRRAPRGKGRRAKEIPRRRRGAFASSPSSAPRLSASRRSAGGREGREKGRKREAVMRCRRDEEKWSREMLR